MNFTSHWRLGTAALAACIGLAAINTQAVTISTFNTFSPNARYASWSSATVNATATNYILSATGYGSLWKQLGPPPLNLSGNTNLVFDIDLSGDPSADGNIGVLVDLTDNDNTQFSYRWFGLNRGHHILTCNYTTTNVPATDNGITITNGSFRIVTNQVGTTAGLDLSLIWHLNLELDPSIYASPYTIAMNDLSITNGAAGGEDGGDTNICATIDSFNNTALHLAGNWSSQTSTPTNIQITATGFGDGWNPTSANADSNATLQLKLTLTAPSGANGALGPIVLLEDSDGTQYRYTFYGQSPGTNVVLTKVLGTGTQVATGSVTGFNFGAIAFYHVQLDPSTYAGSYTVAWNDLSITGCTAPPIGDGVCATLDTFDDDFMSGYYGNWQAANEDSQPTYLAMTATGFGGGFHGLSPIIATDSNKVLRLNLNLTAPSSANALLGPLVVLEDGDGTQLRFAWYGQSPATNLVLTAPLSAGAIAQAGSTSGFNFSALSFFHLQLDPSSYAGSYTVTYNNLDIIGCTAPSISITSSSYDRATHQFTLTWTSENGASYAVEASNNPQSGYTNIASGVPSGGSTTTITVVLSDPDKSFVRVRKE